MKKMKQVRFFILVFFLIQGICSSTYSQNYYSLVDTNKVWNVLYHQAIPPFNYTTKSVKFAGDTIIHSKKYHKVFAQDSMLSIWYYYGRIREDSVKNVFFKPYVPQSPNDTLEKLLYDFSKHANDTVVVQNWQSMTIHHIDSVLVDSQYRKRYFLFYTNGSYNPSFCEKWIEGIGSLNGVLNSGSYGMTGGTFDLLCFTENNILKYQLPAYIGILNDL